MSRRSFFFSFGLILFSTVAQAQWWPGAYYKQGTFVAKDQSHSRSDVLVTAAHPVWPTWGSVVARLAVYEKMISLDTYGTYEVFSVDEAIWPTGITSIGPSAHLVDVQPDSLGNVLFAVRFTDSLFVGDSLMAVADPWSPSELLLAYSPQDSATSWMRPVFGIADLAWNKGTYRVAQRHFGESSVLKLNTQGLLLDSLGVEGLLVSSIDHDWQGNTYVGGLIQGYDTLRAGTFQTYIPMGIAVGALQVDDQGNGQWVQYSSDLTYSFPHLYFSNMYNTLWIAGDLGGQQVWGNDTLQGAQWVYDFFLVCLDPATGAVKATYETPNTAGAITGDYRLASRQPFASAINSEVVLMLSHRGSAKLDGFSLPAGAPNSPLVHGLTFVRADQWGMYDAQSINFPGAGVVAHGHDGDGEMSSTWGAGIAYGDSMITVSDTILLDSLNTDIIGFNLYWEWSIEEEPQAKPSLFPNPTQGDLSVTSGWREGEVIEVFTNHGVRIYRGRADQFSAAGLTSGGYLLRRDNGQQFKFVVRH